MVLSEKRQDSFDSKPVKELKIKAKLALKNFRENPGTRPNWASADIVQNASDLTLKTLLGAAAKKAGFSDWHHARHILDGHWRPGEDAGTFWYSPKCMVFLNIWCRDLEEAEQEMAKLPAAVLFPYKKQYVIGDQSFAATLGLEEQYLEMKWENNRNLTDRSNNSIWEECALARIKNIFSN